MLYLLIIIMSFTCGSKKGDAEVPFENPENKTMHQTDSKYTYLALGDSYTIGESVAQDERFPVQLTNKLRDAKYTMTDARIIARTGWTTDELIAGIKADFPDSDYNLVTLLIGVNNQYRGRDIEEYRTQFAELLHTAIGFANNKAQNVIVVSIPDYGVTPFAENRNPDKIARELDVFNQINLEESKKASTRYVEITTISRRAKNEPALIADDNLHPSGKMYELWAEKLLPVAKEILDSQN